MKKYSLYKYLMEGDENELLEDRISGSSDFSFVLWIECFSD